MKATPVSKVIELLKKVDAQVVEEGKAEAAQYDKYSCFCKEQVDNKLYAIETSEKVIQGLDAKIQELQGDINALSNEIGALGRKITSLGQDIGTKTAARKTEHETYVGDEKDVSDAISACKRAISALHASKGSLAGHTEMEAQMFMQLKKVAVLGLALAAGEISEDAALTNSQLEVLTQLSKAGQPGDAYDYSYHSNDIIATLESLAKTFTKNKNEIDLREFEAKTMFDKAVLDLANEKSFAEADKLEKERIEAYKTEVKEGAAKDLADETNAKTADESFMKVVQQDCQSKAELFDSRSQVRTEELTALSQAMEALKTGVVPNWKANRKLVGLSQKKPAAIALKGHWQWVEDAPPALHAATATAHPKSFLQLRGGNGAVKEADVRRQLLELLRASANKLGSPVLTLTAMKVQLSEDHFVKVRSMIKDIIEKLEAQASAEATTKSFCDTQMKDAVTTRDSEQGKIEDFKAQITQHEAAKAQLVSDIAEISASISASMKALDEATELRLEEKKDNFMVVGQAKGGVQAVEYALEMLQDFYEQYEFAQQGANYVPPDADRSGKTVSDLAPEIFDSDYKGKQKASKGVIGMLNVIMSDFERTGDVVSDNEVASEKQFQEYKKKTEDDVDAMGKQKKDKEGEVADIEDELVTQQDNLKSAQKMLEGALSELEKLTTMCVAGAETYEERIAQRQKEIESLKEAQTILENWQ